MIVFPHCKINLGLQILRKRSDGYHDLATIFYPVALTDCLEVIADPSVQEDPEFTQTGLEIAAGHAENLCVRAYRLLKADFPALPPCRLHLHKVIPMGAGLGGGSSDASYTLRLLNEKFQLQLTPDRLEQYAGQLGSDCAFFIHHKPCLGTGRGDQLKPLDLDLSAYAFVLVYPGIHISTPWAFSRLTPGTGHPDLETIIAGPIGEWKHQLANDFEEPVFREYPQLAAIKATLYEQGALYASLSGSGSTLFGIFQSKPAAISGLPEGCSVFIR